VLQCATRIPCVSSSSYACILLLILQCATRIPQPQTRNRCTSTLLTCKKWYDKQRELTPKATPSLLHTLQRKWYAKQSGASHLSKVGV
jgi:hypothetical protein